MFLSDNGGCHEDPDSWTRKADPNAKIGSPTSYVGYNQPWANVSNTPFRKFKQYTHEGGISSPLIVHWPQGFEARGEFRDQVAHIIDLMPTFLDVAKAEYPSNLGGKPRKPLEGVSLTKAFRDQQLPRGPLFWEHQGHRAVRDGDWKLVASHNDPWELYNLGFDRSEVNNLADSHPEKVKELAAEYEAWTKRCGVLPWPAIASANKWQQAQEN